MAGAYNELDMVIRDFVGLDEFDDDELADPVLYDNITMECTMHIRGEMPLDKMSKDAQYCIIEWEKLLKDCPIERS